MDKVCIIYLQVLRFYKVNKIEVGFGKYFTRDFFSLQEFGGMQCLLWLETKGGQVASLSHDTVRWWIITALC